MTINLVFYRKPDFNLSEGDIGLLFKKVYSTSADLNITLTSNKYTKNSWHSSLIQSILFNDQRYGDKAPQSSLARTFAILWMLEGTVLTTVFSARLTADLTAGEIGYDLNLLGKRVGKKFYL